MKNVKRDGNIYTPHYIVEHILDLSEYTGTGILRKHVIDNSCGDGNFVCAFISRYCMEFLKYSNNYEVLKNELETYIHAIEIDSEELLKCEKRASETALKFGVKDVNWRFVCGNSLCEYKRYEGKMDFVIGNPPYVNIHNFDNNAKIIKTFEFSKSGASDLYLAFCEIGLKMLNESGIFGYIIPNSVFTSKAAVIFRQHVVVKKILNKIVDFKHAKLFPDANTYSCVIVLKKIHNNDFVDYFTYNDTIGRIVFEESLKYKTICQNGMFCLGPSVLLDELPEILRFNKNNNFVVKNGFATLKDSFFIRDNFEIKTKYIIPVVKASTGEKRLCFFPYDQNFNSVKIKEIEDDSLAFSDYLLKNKQSLLCRNLDKPSEWFAFGRSQGINDVNKYKIAISNIVKNAGDIKLYEVPAGVGVYSGFYIISDFSKSEIYNMLKGNDFIEYLSLIGKCKNGGYYTFTTKDLKAFLEFKLATNMCKSKTEQQKMNI